MTDAETEEVADIITHALITYKPDRGMDRTARGQHIVRELEAHGWVLMRED